jgi:hypothetical protein
MSFHTSFCQWRKRDKIRDRKDQEEIRNKERKKQRKKDVKHERKTRERNVGRRKETVSMENRECGKKIKTQRPELINKKNDILILP